MSIFQQLLIMLTIGYVAFTFVAESPNPLKVRLSAKGSTSSRRTRSRYLMAIIISGCLIVSPLTSYLLPIESSAGNILRNIAAVAIISFLALAYRHVKSKNSRKPKAKKLAHSEPSLKDKTPIKTQTASAIEKEPAFINPRPSYSHKPAPSNRPNILINADLSEEQLRRAREEERKRIRNQIKGRENKSEN